MTNSLLRYDPYMDTLKRVIAEPDTVLFIGSGISGWSGLPSWANFIEKLACFLEASGTDANLVRSTAQEGDFRLAASYGFEKLTKQQIGKFIRNACSYGTAEPHAIHRKIISLGPRCFVTTNYDNLIEKSFRKWKPDRSVRPITNRHLTEMADIVQARSTDFIFKTHGDASDVESIILTQEQYRQLLPQGEYHAALESLKILLASRPVVYLGFGLRDPDYLYVKDILANTYKGGGRDHYALMADISVDERDFWRQHYGIHLVDYPTIVSPVETRDHTALLTLLDTLRDRKPVSITDTGSHPPAPKMVPALARHAAMLSDMPKLNPEFNIRVHTGMEESGDNHIYLSLDPFDNSPIDQFLDNGPDRAILVGLPGAGKTYAIRRSAARLAEKLHASCLSDPIDVKSVVMPILVDFKMYGGNLYELVQQALPASLSFEQVARHFKIKVYLDSFNEMPREYWDNGSYEADLTDFSKRLRKSSLIISSRTIDGLRKLGYPVYSLDTIDETDVTSELKRLGIDIVGQFSREVRTLLQRPFYFRYITTGTIKLPKEAHPRDFYRLFFENLCKDFKIRFGVTVDLERALSYVAYRAITRGEEAFPLSECHHVLSTTLNSAGVTSVNARDIANWLVYSSVLMPYAGGRIAFVHQSVTEYLAASELARIYQVNPDISRDILSNTRWDQALFMTLSLLPTEAAEYFLADIIRTDITLALRAVKFLDVGRDEIVSRLLAAIPERIHDVGYNDLEIMGIIQYSLPITDVHEVHLRALIDLGDGIGAASAVRLVELRGEEIKGELLDLLVDRCGDFNLCVNGIAAGLRPFATIEDVRAIAARTDILESRAAHGELDGFVAGAAALLSGLDLSVIRKEFLLSKGVGEVSKIRAQILCDILHGMRSTDALNFAGELLRQGIVDAATSIYFIGNFAQPESNLSWESFDVGHLQHLISALDVEGIFALDALRCLCSARPDLRRLVMKEVAEKVGIKKAALLYCVFPTDFRPLFEALAELVQMSDSERSKQPVHILGYISCDWTGEEELFVELLRLRDASLVTALCGSGNPPSIRGLGNLNIGPISWWLDWLAELAMDESNAWCLDQLGGLFGNYVISEVQQEFLGAFNSGGSQVRRLLLGVVLPYLTDITTDMFSEDALSFLLDDLRREGSIQDFRGHLLGRVATERFVGKRLLPLLEDTEQPLFRNLRVVLRQAGSRHGKRYFVECRG